MKRALGIALWVLVWAALVAIFVLLPGGDKHYLDEVL